MLSYRHIAPSMLPLFGIIIGITGSILVYQDIVSTAHMFMIATLFLMIILASTHYLPKTQRTLILIAACALLGFIRHKTYTYIHNSYPFFNLKQPLVLKAHIIKIGNVERSRYKQNYLVKTYEVVDSEGKSHTITSTLLIYSTQKSTFLIDDKVNFKNIYIRPAKENPYKTYLLKEGICCSLYIDQPKIELEKRPSFSINRFLSIQQNGITDLLSKKMSKNTYTYFLSLFMGDRSHNKWLLEKNAEQFKYWGIVHHLARSGFHLVIFISLWQLIIRLFPIPFLLKQFFLTVLTILYYLLSVSSISFIRALVIFLLYRICIFFEKPVHFTHILCCTAIIVLLYNPMHLLFLDFQLTFLLTLALGILSQLNLAHRI